MVLRPFESRGDLLRGGSRGLDGSRFCSWTVEIHLQDGPFNSHSSAHPDHPWTLGRWTNTITNLDLEAFTQARLGLSLFPDLSNGQAVPADANEWTLWSRYVDRMACLWKAAARYDLADLGRTRAAPSAATATAMAIAAEGAKRLVREGLAHRARLAWTFVPAPPAQLRPWSRCSA